MKRFLLTVWQFPQILIGEIILLFCKKNVNTKIIYNGIDYYFIAGFPGGISLGNKVLLRTKYITDGNTIKHEYGHTIQSKRTGWFYLIIIGLPSAIWALLYGPIIKREHNKYYTFYTEKCADKLGGVIRD